MASVNLYLNFLDNVPFKIYFAVDSKPIDVFQTLIFFFSTIFHPQKCCRGSL